MRKLDKIINNPIAQKYNGIYRIGLDWCYKIIQTFGDSKYSHEFCEWLMNEPNKDINDFEDICFKFEVNKLNK